MATPKKTTKRYATWFTRNGKRYYAKDYGHKAWPIRRK